MSVVKIGKAVNPETSLGKEIELIADVIQEYQQLTGAYPASPNFKVYNYSWFRDGAFIADGMSRAGRVESAEAFFAWCARVITERREHILAGGALEARYTYDGQEANEDWQTFQLDGYGTLLWAIKAHAARHNRSIEAYQEAAGLLQHYLAEHWQEPCIDWWEERKGLHAASLACIHAGLKAYEHPVAEEVRQVIDLNSERTDSSLLVCGLFDVVDSTAFEPTLKRIEAELVSPTGGVHRYAEDEYFGGGEWPLLTSMLGWYYLKIGRIDDAKAKLEWVRAHRQSNGWIPEQSQDHLLLPQQYDPWVAKWGQPANPLLWSNAMFLTLATGLLQTN
jgi:GH15 family glucan-1,4-alpha-glucosidase